MLPGVPHLQQQVKEEGWAPPSQPQTLRDSLEHPPMPLTIPCTQGHVGTCPAASHPRGAGGRAGEGRAHWEPPEIPSTFALKH